MKRVRHFLCTVNPAALAAGLILTVILTAEMIVLGPLEFFGVIVVGILLCGTVIAAGWLIYKLVAIMQAHCCEKPDA